MTRGGIDGASGTVSREFPAAVASAREVRRFVRETLRGLPRDVVDDAATMASELAANAVRHAASDFAVSIERTPRSLRVEVTDEGSGRPELRSPSSHDPSGRGLLIVQEMSGAWGVRTASGGHGKTVWFTVPIEESPQTEARAGSVIPAARPHAEERRWRVPGRHESLEPGRGGVYRRTPSVPRTTVCSCRAALLCSRAALRRSRSRSRSGLARAVRRMRPGPVHVRPASIEPTCPLAVVPHADPVALRGVLGRDA